MTGARINLKTLSLDNSMGGSFIVQKISTNEAYKVALADTTFLKELKAYEAYINEKIKNKEEVTAKDIDKVDALAFEVTKHLVNTHQKKLLKITKLENYNFQFQTKNFGARSNIRNKPKLCNRIS
ncbi:MAG: hypothetical protein IE909_18545 [Campylobacterales bacterium]|nr:hypothetical protein [Campylobacterales bacterium]